MDKNRYTIKYVYPTQAISVLIVVIGSLIDGIMINTFLGDIAQAAYGLAMPLTLANAALCGLKVEKAVLLPKKKTSTGLSDGGMDYDDF